MADEPQIPAAEPAAAAEPTRTAPAQDPSLLETFVPETPPAVEPVVEPVAVEPVADPKAEPAIVEPAKDEPKPDGDKPAEASPVAAPEPVVYEAFTLPEGVAFDDARLDGFRELASEARVPQEKAQSLLDMHTSAMREYADHMSQEQHRVFNETRRGWQSEVKADPEMGGSGFMTAMTAHRGRARPVRAGRGPAGLQRHADHDGRRRPPAVPPLHPQDQQGPGRADTTPAGPEAHGQPDRQGPPRDALRQPAVLTRPPCLLHSSRNLIDVLLEHTWRAIRATSEGMTRWRRDSGPPCTT